MNTWFRRTTGAPTHAAATALPAPPATPLPMAPVPAAALPSPAAPRSALDGPLRAVVVDDDRTLAEQLRDLLVDLGVDVLSVAATGDQALAVARVLDPDVVLTDLRMPGMDGIELTRELRRLPQPPAVVVLSAYDDLSLQDEAAGAGASAYLTKGSSGRQVLAALQAAAGAPC